MLILLIVSFILLIAGIALLIYLPWQHDWCGILPTVIGGVAFASIAILWPVNYYGYLDAERKYYAVKSTIEIARKGDSSSIERAALVQEIIAVNQELASVKYWNTTIFGDGIPDEFANLEYLK